MKINSMKLSIIIMLIIILSGIIGALVFIEIPDGNGKILTTLCGGLLATLIELIADFKRKI